MINRRHPLIYLRQYQKVLFWAQSAKVRKTMQKYVCGMSPLGAKVRLKYAQ